jgi:hypothetical protein
MSTGQSAATAIGECATPLTVTNSMYIHTNELETSSIQAYPPINFVANRQTSIPACPLMFTTAAAAAGYEDDADV